MVKATDICKLIYNNMIVGYRFKLEDGSFTDIDEDTFLWCSKTIRVYVVKCIQVFLVNGECKSKSEIESNIVVEDVSGNFELVSEYLTQIEELRYKELKSKESSTLSFKSTSSPLKGYLKYKINDADTFIEEFKNLGLSREMLLLNIEKYGLEEHSKYILHAIALEREF